MERIVELAAVVVDCQDPVPVAAFYETACGAEINRRDEDSVWISVGGTTVIFRGVENYRPPTWPSSEVPMQVHLDFFVDDLDEAEAVLHQHGATTAEYQAHRTDGLVVMVDPAGHPFCIGTRV